MLHYKLRCLKIIKVKVFSLQKVKKEFDELVTQELAFMVKNNNSSK